eukprot:scaffold184739_cov41-Tisochrysis_lutea.AAC.4
MEHGAFTANNATGPGDSRIQLETLWCAQCRAHQPTRTRKHDSNTILVFARRPGWEARLISHPFIPCHIRATRVPAIGGVDDRGAVSDVLEFDGITWVAAPSLPMALKHLGVAALGSTLYGKYSLSNSTHGVHFSSECKYHRHLSMSIPALCERRVVMQKSCLPMCSSASAQSAGLPPPRSYWWKR